MSSRSFGRRSICRNFSYEFFWTSIRFGIGIEVLILEKSTLSGARPVSDIGFGNSVTAEQKRRLFLRHYPGRRYLETKTANRPPATPSCDARFAGNETE